MTLPAALTSATYDAGNRLTNWAGTALSYDANGNLTADGSLGYGWDSRNRLIALTGASTASFVYDAVGRRSGKTINGTTTNFLYDGANAVQELAGGTPSANLLTGLGIDEVFTDSLGTRSFVSDALGSTVALTDASGAVKTGYAYEPYGNATAKGEMNASSTQYAGRENDGTGLFYYRARYYHPGFSRFVAQDPIGLAGGHNLYAYVGGNPINWIDPLGTTFMPGGPGSSPSAAGAGAPPAGNCTPNGADSSSMQLAASTNNPDYAAKVLGYDRNTFSDMLHEFKPYYSLRPGDNVTFYDNGDVYFGGQLIGNIHDFKP
jgi:RHS repeat-associated protein